MSNVAWPPGVPCRMTSSDSPARSGRVADSSTLAIVVGGGVPGCGVGVATAAVTAREATTSRSSPLSGLLRTVTKSPTFKSGRRAAALLSEISVVGAGVTTRPFSSTNAAGETAEIVPLIDL